MPRNPLNPKRGLKSPASGRQNKLRYGKKTGSRPGMSEKMRALWQDPEYRAKMKARDEKIAADKKANPGKYTRLGVPDGLTKAQVKPMWERAEKLADKFIQILKDTGRL